MRTTHFADVLLSLSRGLLPSGWRTAWAAALRRLRYRPERHYMRGRPAPSGA
ncbi:hypothetical protein [Muricoccus radiodurans]|uniref:hypothetical protein n=1 Tax=Muricoccus radiodurans TaxID=2231721 RepID=UPI003CF43E62